MDWHQAILFGINIQDFIACAAIMEIDVEWSATSGSTYYKEKDSMVSYKSKHIILYDII